MSTATVVGDPPDGVSTTYLIAKDLMKLSSSPWSPPTRETLDMALVIYEAARKVQTSPPVYSLNGAITTENLVQELALIKEELQTTRKELQEARAETARAFLLVNERIGHLHNSRVGQSYTSEARDESLQEGTTILDISSEIGASPAVDSSTGVESSVGAVPPSEISNHLGPQEEFKHHVDTGASTPRSLNVDGVTVVASPSSEGRYTPASNVVLPRTNLKNDHEPEIVDRKVKALLNKLTSENNLSVSQQIIEWVNKSENDGNGDTMIQVIGLVFEKAIDEPNWSEQYARLCRSMMEGVSPNIWDGKSLNPTTGQKIVGGQLFRKYLLNTCQASFERGWFRAEGLQDEQKGGNEPEMLSDEYYMDAKAKRQGLGLVRLICELYKKQMVTERIIHECIKKLLPDLNNIKEIEVKSLCELLTTVGHMLDVPKNKVVMDMYFGRMGLILGEDDVSKRVRFTVLEVLELRERSWKPRVIEIGSSGKTQDDQLVRANLKSLLGRRFPQPRGSF